ncbi:MAG: DSBA oxidoreductase [Microgenomates group bacterium GW2011_GWC2_46_7]|nr:MAG: DSBA oxidoreductase [Microgenomates group bacterium GW2011_GWC2_46_7]
MSKKTILTFVLVTLGILLGVGGLLWQFGNKTENPIADIAGEMRYQMGEGEITLVEFSDFQCPACQFVQAPLKQILTKYSGKVRFVYRDFPLTNIHKNATRAAQAAEAAHQQGKFWEMHDKLFETQSEWSELADPSEKFGVYATELGLEKEKFLVDINSPVTKDIVETDALAARKYQLQGTPTFFVNGIETDFEQLEIKIQELVK